MEDNFADIVKITQQIHPFLREYLQENGVEIDGAGFIKCIHPNHADKNPSCSIGGRQDEQVFHCFSCGAAGNIFHAAHFLENKPLDGVGFYEETLPYLAKKYGIDYEPIHISNEVRDIYQKRCSVKDARNIIHSGAYEKGKLKTDHPAIAHLLERGITKESIKKFKIGCIDGFEGYIKEMQAVGWTNRDWLNRADLSNKSIFNKDGIIIPIHDDKFRPVGFVTRTTKMKPNDKGTSKYVNSINSDIYHKSEILFAFENYVPENGPLFIVEGYLDAIFLDQMGLPNVAALGSTILTEQHVDMLMRKGVKNVILCLDADEGGMSGTKLAVERLSAYKAFKSIRIMELPDGKDPDTYVRENSLKDFIKLSSPDIALSPFAFTIKHTSFEDDPVVVAETAIPTIAAEESNIKRLKMIKELSKITGIAEIDIRKDVDTLVNKESSQYLDELTIINKDVQTALQRRKIKDTKNIIEDNLVKIKSLEKKYDKTIDNRIVFEEKKEKLWEKWDRGEDQYGLKVNNFSKFEEAYDGLPYSTCLTLVGGRPSAGKCLAPGTKIWMYDGSLKNVEDIKLGDALMGDDSSPRWVLGTTSGWDTMWKIRQANAMTYVVNSPHVLSLKRSRNTLNKKHGEIIDIPLNKFIKKSKKFQNNFKGYKTNIVFSKEDTLLDPYFLGLWLGDGDSNSVRIYNMDNEVIEYLYSYAKSLDLNVTVNKNGTCPSYSITKGPNYDSRNFSLQKLLRVENLLGNKHIPKNYIINSDNVRLSLLAGIIDSDGWHCSDKGYYELTLKNLGLIKQVKQVADTLGFRTNLTEKETTCQNPEFKGMAHRLIISGDIWRIPTKIERKKAYRRKKRDWTMSQITITSEGRGRYYGFELDGNGRFLLEDGTVTHNTTWLTALGIDIVESNPDAAVFYMSIDDNTELMTSKIIAQKTGIATSRIKRYANLSIDEREAIRKAWVWFNQISERFIMVDAVEGNTPDVMEKHMDWFNHTFPKKKRIFLLDNFHKLRLPPTRQKVDQMSALSERMKEFTQIYDMHIMMTVELRKMAETGARPTTSDLKDTVQLEYDADSIILVHNAMQVQEDTPIMWAGEYGDDGTRAMPILEVYVKKNKMTGKTGGFAYKLNSYNLQIEEASYERDVKSALRSNAGNQVVGTMKSK